MIIPPVEYPPAKMVENTMKAIQIIRPGSMELTELSVPAITSPGQVLVRLHAAGISRHHTRRVYKGLFSESTSITYPCPPGYPGREGCGEVAAVAADVVDLSPGDRVYLCELIAPLYQEYILTSSQWLLKVSASPPSSALAPTSLFARMLALLERGDRLFRAHCVVIGFGPAGRAAVQWLRVLGARMITVIERDETRMEKAASLGADVVIQAGARADLESLRAVSPGSVIECSGTHDGMQTAFELAAREVLLFGCSDVPFTVNQSLWFHKNLSIISQSGFDWRTWEKTTSFVNRGLIRPGDLVSQVLPFGTRSLEKALEGPIESDACRSVLDFSR